MGRKCRSFICLNIEKEHGVLLQLFHIPVVMAFVWSSIFVRIIWESKFQVLVITFVFPNYSLPFQIVEKYEMAEKKASALESESFSRSRRITPRSSMSEWFKHGVSQYEATQNRGISAERIMSVSDTMRDNVKEVILLNKKETEMRLVQRISDIQQMKCELENVSAVLQSEIEILDILRERIRDGIKIISGKAFDVTEKCIHLREGRRGIDLTHDEVEKELEVEQKTIAGAEDILKKCIEQTNETMRTLRASLYLVSKDIQDKANVLSIECDCLNIKETSVNLCKYTGEIPTDVSNISVEEWARYTKEIMDSSWKKIHSARSFQTHVNAILKEVISDLRKQYEVVNNSFQRRITEIKDAKARLQLQHFEITRQVNDMNQNIFEMETTIREKGAFLALAHTRLEKRANRQGIELVKDEVEATLIKEVFSLKQMISNMQQMLEEAKLSLRVLLKTQLELEEAINIKTHSLKIDEVDCMSVRQGIEYHDI